MTESWAEARGSKRRLEQPVSAAVWVLWLTPPVPCQEPARAVKASGAPQEAGRVRKASGRCWESSRGSPAEQPPRGKDGSAAFRQAPRSPLCEASQGTPQTSSRRPWARRPAGTFSALRVSADAAAVGADPTPQGDRLAEGVGAELDREARGRFDVVEAEAPFAERRFGFDRANLGGLRAAVRQEGRRRAEGRADGVGEQAFGQLDARFAQVRRAAPLIEAERELELVGMRAGEARGFAGRAPGADREAGSDRGGRVRHGGRGGASPAPGLGGGGRRAARGGSRPCPARLPAHGGRGPCAVRRAAIDPPAAPQRADRAVVAAAQLRRAGAQALRAGPAGAAGAARGAGGAAGALAGGAGERAAVAQRPPVAHLGVAEAREQRGQGRVGRFGRQRLAGVALAEAAAAFLADAADRHGREQRVRAERAGRDRRRPQAAPGRRFAGVGVDAAGMGVAGADVDAALGRPGGGVVDREPARGAVDDLVAQMALVVAEGVEHPDHRPRLLGVRGLEIVDDVDLPGGVVDGDRGVAQRAERAVRGFAAVDRLHRFRRVGGRVIDLHRVRRGIGDVEGSRRARVARDRDAVAVLEACLRRPAARRSRFRRTR